MNSRSFLPPQVQETIEILVMTPAELAKHVEQPRSESEAVLERSSTAVLSLEMAVASTLCRILEAKVYEMEGEHGTGSLESDIAMIEASKVEMGSKEWHSLVYRSSQKRLVREYLGLARNQLQSVMRDMAQAVDIELAKDASMQTSRQDKTSKHLPTTSKQS